MKHCGTQRLETERLILRRFISEDASAMYKNWALDDEVTKYLTWPTHSNIDVSKFVIEDWVNSYSDEKYYQWAIVLKENGVEPIGSMDNIINQANEMGCYFFLYTGGEPLVRKKDIIRLCEAHPDCEFSAFTNATLIDEAFADEMLRVKNFIPAISAEGFEESTDSRRGQGTYKTIMQAMEILKAKKLPFGISACYTSANVYDVGSEKYFDKMIEWGAKFCWLFTYMPVGKEAVPELMVTAEQRKFMYKQVRKFRETKALFTMDFWNDGEYSGYTTSFGERYEGGCIAGGRRYLHINAAGDIEPCAFIHYSDSNIREKTLLEALCSPLFMAYRRNQPFSENKLRPCPVLDNPGALTKIVEETGAKSTDYSAQETAREYSNKCEQAAASWKPIADELWRCSGHCGCDPALLQTKLCKISYLVCRLL